MSPFTPPMTYDYLVYQGTMPLLQLYDPDGLGGGTAASLTHRYLHGAGGQVVADDYQATGSMWLLTDHEGTVRDIAYYNGNSYDVTHRTYSSFGELLTSSHYSTPAIETIIGFQGSLSSTTDMKRVAAALAMVVDLDWMGIRVYRPSNGRFLSEDPTMPRPDSNFYRAFGNNPLNMVDPTGRCKQSVSSNDWIFGSLSDSYKDIYGNSGDDFGLGLLGGGLYSGNYSSDYGSTSLSFQDYDALSRSIQNAQFNAPEAEDHGLPVAAFSFPGGDIGVGATANGKSKYYLNGQEISHAKLETFLEKSSPPQDARQALFMISARRSTYQERAGGEFTAMFKAAPPTGKGLPTSYTDDDYQILGNALAEAHINNVQGFLQSHSGAAPKQGIRPTDTYRFYSGTIPTRQEVAACPVCEDWAGEMYSGLQNVRAKVTLSSGTYPLASFYETNWAQKWGPLEASLGITTGQHNFTAVFPKGYAPSSPPANDPVMRVVESWSTLLPNVYTTSGYRQATGAKVDAIGRTAEDCRPK